MSFKEILARRITAIEWLLGVFVVVVSSLAWVSDRNFADITLYDIFPPLGLVAFGLMWTYYVIGALRQYADIKGVRSDMYMTVSTGLVLALLILHPGLLWIGLYMDGYGLPPSSYLEAYKTQLGFVILGTCGLFIFLSYELRRFFRKRRWWKYIVHLQTVGMAVIFVHAIGLGGELKLNWFMALWIFYGVTLALSIIYSSLIHVPKEGTRGTK